MTVSAAERDAIAALAKPMPFSEADLHHIWVAARARVLGSLVHLGRADIIHAVAGVHGQVEAEFAAMVEMWR